MPIDSKPREWPPRLRITPGGIVATWARSHNLAVTRDDIEELLGCFGVAYDHWPDEDAEED